MVDHGNEFLERAVAGHLIKLSLTGEDSLHFLFSCLLVFIRLWKVVDHLLLCQFLFLSNVKGGLPLANQLISR